MQLAMSMVGRAVVGRWLAWNRRTVILDALEDLQRTARQAR
ncbi:hypothetical protein [Streptomyces echinatus]